MKRIKLLERIFTVRDTVGRVAFAAMAAGIGATAIGYFHAGAPPGNVIMPAVGAVLLAGMAARAWIGRVPDGDCPDC